jgi:adenosine deaminase
MVNEQLERYLATAPKAELHVHLEGAIDPTTLLILAQRNSVTLPVNTVEEMQQWFVFRDFNHFVDIYLQISRCLKSAEDYELIAYEFGVNMARQNIRYAEITFSPSTHQYALGVPFETYFTGLSRGRERAKQEFGVEMRWIFDIVRNIEDEARNRELSDYTTSVAIEARDEGVVALGLGGAEVGYPPESFERYFERARAAGLHSIPHAGETSGPASIWGAIRALGAERIGHGVRSIEDPQLVAYLAEEQIPLEVCPTSNICLGVYPSLHEHPMPQLYEAGVPVTINSDDPPLFNTFLNNEVKLLADPFNFNLDTINTILLNGVRYSCLPTEEKQALEARFKTEMDLLRQELGL